MLEQAMEDCTRFEENELRKLMKNPVIWPLLRNLVFTSNGRTGFYTDGLLITADGICLPLTPKEELRIAHPTDLYAVATGMLIRSSCLTKLSASLSSRYSAIVHPDNGRGKRYAIPPLCRKSDSTAENGCRTERTALGSRLRGRTSRKYTIKRILLPRSMRWRTGSLPDIEAPSAGICLLP